MNLTATLRRLGGLLAAGAAALLLAGCVVVSKTSLVSPGEAVAILPDTFMMTTYQPLEDGSAYEPSDDPAPFTQVGKGYRPPDESMMAYFVSLGSDGQYLLATVADDSTMYGVARLRDSILEIRMLFAGDPTAIVASAGIAGADTSDGSITVADRAALDAVIALIADGALETEPLLAWTGADPAPATLVAAGGWYAPGD